MALENSVDSGEQRPSIPISGTTNVKKQVVMPQPRRAMAASTTQGQKPGAQLPPGFTIDEHTGEERIMNFGDYLEEEISGESKSEQ